MPKLSKPAIYIILFALALTYAVLIFLRMESLRATIISLANSTLTKVHHPAPPDTPSVVDISNWKTYRNEKYGYEIKYPPNLKVENDGDIISFSLITASPNNESKPVSIEPIQTNGRSIQELFSGPNPPRTVDVYSECKSRTIAQRDSYLCAPAISFAGESFAIVPFNRHLIFVLDVGNDTSFIDQFLSTFKFIN